MTELPPTRKEGGGRESIEDNDSTTGISIEERLLNGKISYLMILLDPSLLLHNLLSSNQFINPSPFLLLFLLLLTSSRNIPTGRCNGY